MVINQWRSQWVAIYAMAYLKFRFNTINHTIKSLLASKNILIILFPIRIISNLWKNCYGIPFSKFQVRHYHQLIINWILINSTCTSDDCIETSTLLSFDSDDEGTCCTEAISSYMQAYLADLASYIRLLAPIKPIGLKVQYPSFKTSQRLYPSIQLYRQLQPAIYNIMISALRTLQKKIYIQNIYIQQEEQIEPFNQQITLDEGTIGLLADATSVVNICDWVSMFDRSGYDKFSGSSTKQIQSENIYVKAI